MINCVKARNFCPVANMIRSIARSCTAANLQECTADKVMNHGNAFCCKEQRSLGQKNIIVNKCRSVTNLYEDILAAHAALCPGAEIGAIIVM